MGRWRGGAAMAARAVSGTTQERPQVVPAAAQAQRYSRLASVDRRLHRVLKSKHLAIVLGRMGLGVLLQEERRDLAATCREERLVGEQLDAAGGIEDVSHIDFLALGLVVGIGP